MASQSLQNPRTCPLAEVFYNAQASRTRETGPATFTLPPGRLTDEGLFVLIALPHFWTPTAGADVGLLLAPGGISEQEGGREATLEGGEGIYSTLQQCRRRVHGGIEIMNPGGYAK